MTITIKDLKEKKVKLVFGNEEHIQAIKNIEYSNDLNQKYFLVSIGCEFKVLANNETHAREIVLKDITKEMNTMLEVKFLKNLGGK